MHAPLFSKLVLGLGSLGLLFWSPPSFSHAAFDPAAFVWETGQIIGISEVNEPKAGITFFFEVFTGSRFGHVGVVAERTPGEFVVYESYVYTPPVFNNGIKVVTLKDFLARAKLASRDEYAATVVRYRDPVTQKGLSPEQKAELLKEMERKVAENIRYNFSQNYNDATKNCAEFIYDAFAKIGIHGVGKLHHYRELNLGAFAGVARTYYEKDFYFAKIDAENFKTVTPFSIMISPQVEVLASNLPVDHVLSEKEVLATWVAEKGIQHVAGFSLGVKAQMSFRPAPGEAALTAYAEKFLKALEDQGSDQPYQAWEKLR